VNGFEVVDDEPVPERVVPSGRTSLDRDDGKRLR
jgi:hypothetical protein